MRRHKDGSPLDKGEDYIRFLAAIVESSDDAIITKDLSGIITSWNRGAENMFGYTAREAVGKSVSMLIPPDRENEEPTILKRLRNGERIDHYETARRRKDGSLIHISLTVSPVRDAHGTIIGASKIARDITRRKLVEQQMDTKNQIVADRTASLERAVEQMEEFSYSVSHDLKAPIRAMKGFALAIQKDYSDQLNPDVRDKLQRIIQSGERMERLVQDVLTYSRIARIAPPLQPVAIDKLVPDIVEQYPAMQPPKAEISVRHPLLPVMGHEPSLTQAISNLLANAVKFVSPGVTPKIKVWTELDHGHVRLWVQDNGIGIKPEYQNRLFGMFKRVHNKGDYDGTGIGLAIVRKAVEKMGGRTGVESDGLHGSAFWIELPGLQ